MWHTNSLPEFSCWNCICRSCETNCGLQTQRQATVTAQKASRIMTTACTGQTQRHGADQVVLGYFLWLSPKKNQVGPAIALVRAASPARMVANHVANALRSLRPPKRVWRNTVRTACTAECLWDKKLRSLTWPQQRPGLSRTVTNTLGRVLCPWQIAMEFCGSTSASHAAILGH